jgi:hypothetical protein
MRLTERRGDERGAAAALAATHADEAERRRRLAQPDPADARVPGRDQIDGRRRERLGREVVVRPAPAGRAGHVPAELVVEEA